MKSRFESHFLRRISHGLAKGEAQCSYDQTSTVERVEAATARARFCKRSRQTYTLEGRTEYWLGNRIMIFYTCLSLRLTGMSFEFVIEYLSRSVHMFFISRVSEVPKRLAVEATFKPQPNANPSIAL